MRTLGVGVIGAHRWAERAHLPGFAACERVRLLGICDAVPERAAAMAAAFGIARVYPDHRAMLDDPAIGMVDVCTPTATHAAICEDALAAGRHVLCEKPLALDAATAFGLAARASSAGVRTKLGFTFRYSPAVRQLRAWIADGTLGEIFHIQGFQQNAQFLDPLNPLRQFGLEADAEMEPGSVVEYGAHLVDLMRWCGGEFAAVSASMRSFIPARHVRGKEGLQAVRVEDATVGLVEFASGAQGVLQTSIVAVGNYPGVELRVYGSKGAAIARLVVEGGIAETLHVARADAVEFVPVALPGVDLRMPWPELYLRGLVRHFADEILDDLPAENTFLDGARSQAIVDALVLSHRERRWVEVGA